MIKKYRALRIIGTIYKILGTITGIITILAALGLCATSVMGGAAVDSLSREFGGSAGLAGAFGGLVGGLVLSVIAVIYGGGLAITLYAMGEGVDLLIALEENTRATVSVLQQLKSE